MNYTRGAAGSTCHSICDRRAVFTRDVARRNVAGISLIRSHFRSNVSVCDGSMAQKKKFDDTGKFSVFFH